MNSVDDMRSGKRGEVLIQWIGWIGATAAAALTMASYTHTTFETVSSADRREASIAARLDRIEEKLDRLLLNGR